MGLLKVNGRTAIIKPDRLRVPRWLAGPLLLPLLLLAFPAQGTNFEISRLASQLSHASTQLAIAVRNHRGYSSVQFSASKLSREAAQLVNAVSRQRSPSYLRSEFNDIARRYQDLERSFLRSQRGEHSPYLYQQVDRISYLFGSLDAQFHYYEPYEYRSYSHRYPPSGVHRGYRPPIQGGGSHYQRKDRRDYGSITATRPMRGVETQRRNHWDRD